MLLSYECFQESLLDRQDFLQWLLDLLDKSKNADDLLLKYLIPLLLRVCITGRRQKWITAHVCAVQDATCALIGHYRRHYLPLLTSSGTRHPHLIFCQLSKGKKTLWKLDASFPIQYLIHTWCFPTPPTLKHQLLSWSYIDEFNWWLLFWTLISVCWPDSPVPNTCQESCTGVFQEAVYALL